MRSLFFLAASLAVMGLAFWAYRENYQTQQSQRSVRALQNEIGALREALSVQRAEWAYLNRPERLEELADLNFDKLNLLPLDPGQFGEVPALAYPLPPVPQAEQFANMPEGAIASPVDVVGAQAPGARTAEGTAP